MSTKPMLITPPTGDVVTPEEMREKLLLTATRDDVLIAGFIDAAVGILEGHEGLTGRFFLIQTWATRLAAWPVNMIMLPFSDVKSVVVKYRDTSEAEQTFDSAQYELIQDDLCSLVVYHTDADLPSVSSAPYPITIEMTVGYGDAAAVPEKIKNIIRFMVEQWYDNPEALSDSAMEIPAGVDMMINSARLVSA